MKKSPLGSHSLDHESEGLDLPSSTQNNSRRSDHFFVRLDKIGDLLVSLPCDEIPESQIFHQNLRWIVDENNLAFLELSVPRRKGLGLKAGPWKESFSRLLELFKTAQSVVILQGPWWVSYAAWRAGVPIRVGRFSQWHSFLFLNFGLRQRRHLSETHEACYGADLVRKASEVLRSRFNSKEEKHLKPGNQKALQTYDPSPSRVASLPPPPILHLQAPSRGAHLFEKLSLRNKNYVVIHCGMQGSALNWSSDKYADCVSLLLAQLPSTWKIVITGLSGESQELLKSLAGLGPKEFDLFSRVVDATGKLSLKEWMQVLQSASCVLGPSSGVVHVAASLGTAVVGLYSPVRAQSSVRWGPRGVKVRVLTPSLADNESCPGTQKCLGASCKQHPCMERISAQAAVTQIINFSRAESAEGLSEPKP